MLHKLLWVMTLLMICNSFMVEGAENDDHWRMVEDEFLSVANTFTVHLHAAEYHRLNSLAKEQNADTINSISRPVTGVMTSSVKRRQDAVARLAKQHSGLKRARSNVDEPPPDDDDRTPWTGTSLHRLMDSPRKKSMRLTSVTSAVPATRAAAGYLGSSPSNGSGRFTDALSNTAPRPRAPVKQIREESETSDDGDDLDGPVHRQPAFPASSSSAVSHRISHHRPSNMNLDTNSEAPEQVESDNPDGGLFLRSIRERRQRQGNRWRTSSDGVTVKEERRD